MSGPGWVFAAGFGLGFLMALPSILIALMVGAGIADKAERERLLTDDDEKP